MNALFCNFCRGNALVPKYLQERSLFKDVHLIVDTPKDLAMNSKSHLFVRDCQLGRFENIESFDNIPLDEEILFKLASVESTVLKMMERYQHTQGLLKYEERINLYHKQVRYWHNYLITNRIDYCFFAVIPHVVYDYIIYSICKMLGIRTFMLYRIPVLPGKNVSIYILDDIKRHICGLKNNYKKYFDSKDDITLSNRMEAYFELRSGNEGKTFTGIEGTKNGIVKYFQVSKYINYIKFCYNWFSLWGNGYDLIDRFLYNIHKPKDLTIGFNRNPNLSCRYIFVALHYQPECTTSPMGGAYVHQDLMLNILIKSIPDDIKIYIKPHPRKGLSRTLQNRMYIDSRVEIISPVYNSYDLIIKSLAVATVTGTTGWEAFINKIPVLMFGEYFYQDAPGVFSVKTLSDVVFAISNILDEKFVISERMVRAFLKALDEKTFPGWVDNRYADLSDIEVQQNAINIAANLSNAIKRQS